MSNTRTKDLGVKPDVIPNVLEDVTVNVVTLSQGGVDQVQVLHDHCAGVHNPGVGRRAQLRSVRIRSDVSHMS